jgi:hypothetical protein
MQGVLQRLLTSLRGATMCKKACTYDNWSCKNNLTSYDLFAEYLFRADLSSVVNGATNASKLLFNSISSFQSIRSEFKQNRLLQRSVNIISFKSNIAGSTTIRRDWVLQWYDVDLLERKSVYGRSCNLFESLLFILTTAQLDWLSGLRMPPRAQRAAVKVDDCNTQVLKCPRS